ncbi:uncharacterized protein LOC129907660 [Episyrphus balteatus]|uniref:uncharacterized protein LOC129907660 n=1 Tax=Episyrphus balteatus TaxID=286459 RepID=UPI0024853503|nr:uncharacterized protein LOC129907660 [Episyrphus balteatus]
MANTDNMCLQLNASELTAIMMKGSQQSNDRDAGFCSGGSEGGDDLSMDHSRLDPSSPTDASEDSVEVKVTPITLIRNKRKSTEPSKVICDREETGPLKKRIRYSLNAASYEPTTPTTPTTTLNTSTNRNHHHHRTSWDSSQQLPHELMPNPAEVLIRHPGVTTLHRLPIQQDDDIQDEPLALVLKKPSSSEEDDFRAQDDLFQHKELHSHNITPSVASSSGSISGGSFNHEGRPQQRNYKNMTRERRIEANARERTRVHTISAAYETLRKAVPSYSNSQKLSKLSVLRVACSYILTLSRMAGEDYSEDQSEPSIASCMEQVTATIQTEGKIRKKKDE